MKYTERVAVYGSLRAGMGNHRLLENAKLVAATKTKPEFKMISVGAFPAVFDGDDAVVVEVYDVDDYTMQRLDWLEGYPAFYNRKKVKLENGMEAWIYYWDDPDPDEYKKEPIIDWVKFIGREEEAYA